MRRLLAVLLATLVLAAAGCSGPDRKFGAHIPGPKLPPPIGPSQRTTPPPPHGRLVAAVARVRTPQGYQLRIKPTRFGRNWAWEQPVRALVEVLKLARPLPLHLTPSMRASLLDQLHCHAAFAMTKPTWDIETWRPDVGYARTVGALCNPD